MKIAFGVKFILHKRHAGDTSAAIRMRVTLRGQRPFDVPTGHEVQIENWDTNTQHVTPAEPGSELANRTIDEWRAMVNEIMARYEILEKRVPEPAEVKELFNDMAGRTSKVAETLPTFDQSIFPAFDKFTDTMGTTNQWTPATYTKFAAIRRHLHDFDAHLTFDQVDNRKMQTYLQYLNKQDFNNTTISKHLAFVRWFFRWANANGYYNGTIHDTFKPKLKGTDGNAKEIIYLSRDELQMVMQYKFKHGQEALECVRDVFVFCCFSSLRYSDVAKLKKSDIKDGYIDVVTQKTVDGLRIELNNHSTAILEKYKDLPGDKALPVISNQKMNDHLKTLGQVVGLTEPTRVVYFKGNTRHEDVFPKWALMTTHVARRTFVIMALQLGVPAEVIMKWTGHANFEAMKPYIKIVDELKAREMSRFDDL